MRVGGRAQGGYTVWRRGGVDGRPGKVLRFVLYAEDWLEEDGGGGGGIRRRAYKVLSLELAVEPTMNVDGE